MAMLNLFVGTENFPKNLEYIYRPSDAFNQIGLRDTQWTRNVLRSIEQAEYQDEETFIDRLGRGLFYENLSTGTKFLLLLEYTPDKLLNPIECGRNVWAYVLHATFGNIYFENPEDYNLYPQYPLEASLNGIVYTDPEDLILAMDSYGL